MRVGKGKRSKARNRPKLKRSRPTAGQQRARSVRKRPPRITIDTSIKEVVDRYPDLYGVFEDHGLHFCAGCYVMLASTIGTGANYSGLKPADRRALLKELNRLAAEGVHGTAPASSSAA
jgi:hypothetical protein